MALSSTPPQSNRTSSLKRWTILLVLTCLAWTGLGVGATTQAGIIPAGPLSDPRGDVSNPRGDVLGAEFTTIGGWAITLAQAEDYTSAAWKSGATRIVIKYDVNADRVPDFQVTLRVVPGRGSLPIAIGANAAGGELCYENRNLRFHPEQTINQIGDNMLVTCFGSPAKYSAWGQLIRCDTATGKVTTDRFPNSGWIGPFNSIGQPSKPGVPSPNPYDPPPACRKTTK